MLFSKTGSFILPFIQKLISSSHLFEWCCVTLWLLVHSYANFYGKPDLFLVLIFVKSLIDVHQIARKKESVLKDLDITDRPLHNMLMNSSLLRRFRFSDVFHL